MDASPADIDWRGLRLAAVLTRPDARTDKCVVLVHGGPGGDKNGPDNLFVDLAADLADKGIASLRFDMLGAGESEGDYAAMTLAGQAEQLGEVVRSARGHGGRRLGVVGESLGAAAVLLGWPPHARVGALLWPTIDLPDTSLRVYLEPHHQEQLRVHGYTEDGEDRVGRAFIEEFQRLGNLENLLTRLEAPVLLIHGDADAEVPHRQSQRAFELLPEPKRLLVVPGGGHGLRRGAEQRLVRSEVTQWMARHL